MTFFTSSKVRGKEKKIRWNTRDRQLHRNSGIFVKTLRSKKTRGKNVRRFIYRPDEILIFYVTVL